MEVVAAVIERCGKILICQRKRGGRHGLKWEFPGGKLEPGEDAPSALARELREELNIDAQIGEEMHTEHFRYENGPPFILRFYRVTEFSGQPVNVLFETILWEDRKQLRKYDFLEGDRTFLQKLENF